MPKYSTVVQVDMGLTIEAKNRDKAKLKVQNIIKFLKKPLFLPGHYLPDSFEIKSIDSIDNNSAKPSTNSKGGQ